MVSPVDQLMSRMALPVLGAPMFIVSTPEFVIAQCTSGVIGGFPALNARPAEVLDEWLTRIEAALEAYRGQNPAQHVAPFAVNQIIHQAAGAGAGQGSDMTAFRTE